VTKAVVAQRDQAIIFASRQINPLKRLTASEEARKSKLALMMTPMRTMALRLLRNRKGSWTSAMRG
jgi:hypothetical protein